MSGKNTIRILVCYHSDKHVFKNSVLKPIELGRALARAEGAPGGRLPDMLGDDTGDNISTLNPMFCEMTALYWAWRNYAELGNPDYCGLMHYRRLLHFASSDSLGIYRIQSPLEVAPASIAPEIIHRVVPQYDICVKAPIGITYEDKNGEPLMYTVMGQYLEAHADRYLVNAFNLVSEKYPDYIDDIKSYSNSTAHYLCNIAVMRREAFFDYAEWMFSILLPLHEMIDYERPGQDIRAISYISERLSGLYISRQRRLRKLKIKHIPSININCW